MTLAVLVALLSGLGAVGRVALTDLLARSRPRDRHRATLVLNVAGAGILGVLTGAGVTGDALLLAGTALLGSFTTFSTWMADEDALVRAGRPDEAARLLAAAVLLGIAAAAGGWALAAALA